MVRVLLSDVVRHAFVGGSIAALVAAVVGYFLVLRAQAFASEAFTDVGFAGASGAALAGVNPLFGMIVFVLIAAVGLGFLSERRRGRDVEIGMILSFALGVGVLFLSIYSHAPGGAMSGVNILFGSLLTLTAQDTDVLLIASFVILSVLMFIARPLLFASIDSVVAAARGIPTRQLSVVFLVLLALSVAFSARIVGVLLVPALMIAPAATAVNICRRPLRAIFLAILVAEAIVWVGLFLGFTSFLGRLPVGFYVTTLSAGVYFASMLTKRFSR